MVTWGSNTTFSIPGSSAQINTSAASQPAPSFGSPSPATTSTSAFSFSPSLLSPSPSSGFFSPSATPLSSSSATSSSAMNPYSHMLGAPQQAALQAHMTAAMNQETCRIEQQLSQLYAAFAPFQTQSASTQLNTMSRFQHIFYDTITEAQKLERLALPSFPPKPSHIPEETWHIAISCNPDPENYIPVLVSSAEGLHSRLLSQQNTLKLHEKYMSQLDATIEARGDAVNQSIIFQLEEYHRKNAIIRQNLTRIMQKLEIIRGKNIPLQPSEKEAFANLKTLYQQSLQAMKMVEVLKSECLEYSRQLQRAHVTASKRRGHVRLDDRVQKEAMDILKSNKVGIDELTKRVRKDERDVNIMLSALSQGS